MEQVRGKGDEGHQILFLSNSGDVFNDAVQDIVRKGSRSKSVMLCRFNHVFVVPSDGFELLLDGVSHFGGAPDIGFQEVGEKFVRLLELFFDVVEMFFVEVDHVQD